MQKNGAQNIPFNYPFKKKKKTKKKKHDDNI